MRLETVAHGHTLGKKLVMVIIRLTSGFRAPDVVRTLLYRGKFFGRPQSKLTQAVMRGPSDWAVGERELFAAFVSSLNHCVF